MAPNFLEIESTTGLDKAVKQDLKFKTGNFVWRVKFNTALDPATINNQNLYVTTLSMNPLKTTIRYDTFKNEIEIEPLEPYAKEESYLLHISKNVRSKGGKNLKSDIQIQFKL